MKNHKNVSIMNSLQEQSFPFFPEQVSPLLFFKPHFECVSISIASILNMMMKERGDQMTLASWSTALFSRCWNGLEPPPTDREQRRLSTSCDPKFQNSPKEKGLMYASTVYLIKFKLL